jgi:hypothetical protein
MLANSNGFADRATRYERIKKMDLNGAILDTLLERIEELEDRVRVLEVGLDMEPVGYSDFDDLDYDILPEDEPLD